MNKKIKIILIITGAVLILGTATYLFFLSPSAKKRNRKIRFVRRNPDGSKFTIGFAGVENTSSFTGSFNSLKIDVPAIQKKFNTDASLPQVKALLQTIRSTYKKEIAQAVKETKVPEEIVTSFIYVESNGKPTIIGGISVGLMQINPDAAVFTIWKEKKDGRLSEAEIAVIKRVIGESNYNCIISAKYSGQQLSCGAKVTNQHLFNPEFNILIGAALIGILMDESVENGVVRLDRVIVRYNKGYYAKNGLAGDINAVYANSGQTSSYISKIMGQNGTLDLLVEKEAPKPAINSFQNLGTTVAGAV